MTLRVARANKVIGMVLTQQQCADALQRLGLAAAAGPGTLTVTPPAYRFDLAIEEDLIEEVVRVIGYDKLPTTAPLAPMSARLRPESQRSRFELRRVAAALGYQETINFSFVEERWERELAGNQDPIRLLNPIASQMSVMRSSMLGSLLQALRFNLDRRAERVRVFEIGRVFSRDSAIETTDGTVRGILQPMRIAGLAYGDVEGSQWGRKAVAADFYDVRGDVETLLSPVQAEFVAAEHPAMHPGRCARVLVRGRDVGVVGELHPRWRQQWEFALAPVLFELELDAVQGRGVATFAAVPRFQPAERDIAVIVKEAVAHSMLMQAISSAETAGLLRHAMLFDVYKPRQGGGGVAADEKSMAVRLTLGSAEATLTDEQIEAAVQAVIDSIATRLGGRLRE